MSQPASRPSSRFYPKLRGLLEHASSENWLLTGNARLLKPGVSVILPTYESLSTLGDALDSIAQQTLDFSLIQLIVIQNGPDDGSLDLIRNFTEKHSSLEILLVQNNKKGAGAARNRGLKFVNREFVTFLDSDDAFEPEYLSNAVRTANENTIAVNPILNSENWIDFSSDNVLNKRIQSLPEEGAHLYEFPWLLGFNACKTVPSRLILGLEYDEDLDSGEDLVFFAQLLSNSDTKIKPVEQFRHSAYLRRVRTDSVSRRPESFAFNVEQRLACIAKLREIQVPGVATDALDSIVAAQFGFIQRYVTKHSECVDRLEEVVIEQGIKNFPWDKLNHGEASGLVISYCFAPFSDTSATVAAKAVAERRQIVDVISNDMSSVRRYDSSLFYLCNRWIDDRVLISEPVSFAGWDQISKFALSALIEADKRIATKTHYESMYSRALWVGSHVAALLIKDRYREIRWTAEFSDPLRYGSDGTHREGELTSNQTAAVLERIVGRGRRSDIKIDSLFDLVEVATFILADELIFTNDSQLLYMLRDYPSDIQESVRAKSVVRPHPKPPATAYHAVDSPFEPIAGRVNIGYFGSFYKNRGLGDVFAAIRNLKASSRDRIYLHIFCNAVDEAKRFAEELGVQGNVSVSGYLPYMEFLNVSTKMDVLLVNDITRDANFDINPFLPSKYSDYIGSGSKVWASVDEGSPLSKLPADYRSRVGDQLSAVKCLEKISHDFFAASRVGEIK